MKRIWFWARLLLSAALIVFLLVTVDFRELGASVRQANVTFLSLALLSALLDRVMMAYKWDVLLKAKSIRIPLVRLTGTYLVSTFLGLFLPATLGGDAVRAFAVSKEGHNSKDVISSILVERLLGTIALLILVLASIAFSVFVFGQSFFANLSQLFWILLAISVGLTILMLLSMNRSLLKRGIGLLRSVAGERRPPAVDGDGTGERRSTGGERRNKLILKLREVYSSYLSFSEDKPALAAFLLLSFVENLFPLNLALFGASLPPQMLYP